MTLPGNNSRQALQINKKHELFIMKWAAMVPIWTRICVPCTLYREESAYDTLREQF